MPWNMLHFDQLRPLPVPEQFFAFSDAYLNAASQLCDSLCEKADGRTYADGAVVMSLAYHAVELFLKAAILLKKPQEQLPLGRAGHDLEFLYRRYVELYPDQEHQFEIPFGYEIVTIVGEHDERLAEELMAFIDPQKNIAPPDQVHRYPTDGKFDPWDNPLGFVPGLFATTLNTLHTDLTRVRLRVTEAADDRVRL